MTSLEQRRLTYHGAITFLLSLTAGAVFMVALVTHWEAEPVRAWGAAHRSLIVMSVWQLATAAILPMLVLTQRAARVMANSVIWGTYMIAFSVWLSALAGVRGLAFDGPFVNYLTWSVNGLGGTLTAVGAFLIFRGAASALKTVASPGSPQ